MNANDPTFMLKMVWTLRRGVTYIGGKLSSLINIQRKKELLANSVPALPNKSPIWWTLPWMTPQVMSSRYELNQNSLVKKFLHTIPFNFLKFTFHTIRNFFTRTPPSARSTSTLNMQSQSALKSSDMGMRNSLNSYISTSTASKTIKFGYSKPVFNKWDRMSNDNTQNNL
jgi:hypothetical protein